MIYRVLMVGACPFPAPQGSQVLLRNTAEALWARGHDVRLMVYGHGVNAAEAGDAAPAGGSVGGHTIYRARGIPGVHRIVSGPYPTKPLLDFLLAIALRKVARAEKFDILHAHNYEALIAALIAGKRPIVYHAHNAMADELPYFWPGTRTFGRWLDVTFPHRADFIIVPHARLAEYLVGCGCKPEKIAVIPPSMNVDLFPEPGFSEDLPQILYLGNLDRYQNIALLRKAMARAREEISEARLIVGTAAHPPLSPFKGGFRNAILPVFDFHDLKACLSTDCIAACPRVSWSGYPIKMINAMAAGRPVVACESAAHPVKNGKTGLVVADDDAEAFAQALIRLLLDRDLRIKMGLAARSWVRQELNPETVGKQVETVYSKIAAK